MPAMDTLCILIPHNFLAWAAEMYSGSESNVFRAMYDTIPLNFIKVVIVAALDIPF
jgi:hypothetical protein